MLDISPILVLFSGIMFLALLVLLNTIFYKPMIEFMDNRNQSFSSNDDAIKAYKNDIAENELKVKSILDDANHEYEGIISEAITNAHSKAEDKLAKVIENLDSQYDKFIQELTSKQEELKNNIIANSSAFKKELSNKLVNI